VKLLIIFVSLYIYFCTEPLHSVTVVDSGVIRLEFRINSW